jgi:hypothetical protein
VYELTDRGRQLRPVLLALGTWGLPLLGEPRPGEQFRLAWLMIALDGHYQPTAVPAPTTVVLDIAGDAVTITAHHDRHTVTPGAAAQADLTITAAGREPFLAWLTGQLDDRRAITAGVTATGGTRGLRRLRAMSRRIDPAHPWRRCDTSPAHGRPHCREPCSDFATGSSCAVAYARPSSAAHVGRWPRPSPDEGIVPRGRLIDPLIAPDGTAVAETGGQS